MDFSNLETFQNRLKFFFDKSELIVTSPGVVGTIWTFGLIKWTIIRMGNSLKSATLIPKIPDQPLFQCSLFFAATHIWAKISKILNFPKKQITGFPLGISDESTILGQNYWLPKNIL